MGGLFATKAPRAPFFSFFLFFSSSFFSRVSSFAASRPVVACGATASLQWAATGGRATDTLYANGETALAAGKVSLPFGTFTSGVLRADTTSTLQTLSQGRPSTTQLTVFVRSVHRFNKYLTRKSV